MRLRARDVCLAVVVLVLVGTGLHAVVGEFTHHSWRTAIRGVNGGFPGVVPGRQCVAVSGGFARRSWATLSPFWARRRGACLWRGGASLASIGSCRGLCGCFILAQFPKCMHGLLIAAARQARGDALPTMPMRWNHRR